MATLQGVANTDSAISVEEFIDLQSTDDVTYYNYSILEYLNGFDVFLTNLLYDYEDEFQDVALTIQLNDLEKFKYRYKPYLLAYDLYGSTETAFILMMLNGIIDPKEFVFEKIKVLRPSDLNDILSRIRSVNEEFLYNNREKLESDFTNHEGNKIWKIE